MTHGSKPATVLKQQFGTNAETNPAPARKLAIADKAIAPLMPREPPMSKIEPWFPLWLFGCRIGNRGTGQGSSVFIGKANAPTQFRYRFYTAT
jgi:hypothetical protein